MAKIKKSRLKRHVVGIARFKLDKMEKIRRSPSGTVDVTHPRVRCGASGQDKMCSTWVKCLGC